MHYVSPRGQGLGSPTGKSPRGRVLKPCPVFWTPGAQLGSEAGVRLLKPDTALGGWQGKGLQPREGQRDRWVTATTW